LGKNDKYLAPIELFRFLLPAVLSWLQPWSCNQKVWIF